MVQVSWRRRGRPLPARSLPSPPGLRRRLSTWAVAGVCGMMALASVVSGGGSTLLSSASSSSVNLGWGVVLLFLILWWSHTVERRAAASLMSQL